MIIGISQDSDGAGRPEVEVRRNKFRSTTLSSPNAVEVGLSAHAADLVAEDYHLGAGSPAIDAGSNHPPGGLGPFDIDGETRRRGTRVDIGADETGP
jgi:hypothetical protein